MSKFWLRWLVGTVIVVVLLSVRIQVTYDAPGVTQAMALVLAVFSGLLGLLVWVIRRLVQRNKAAG